MVTNIAYVAHYKADMCYQKYDMNGNGPHTIDSA